MWKLRHGSSDWATGQSKWLCVTSGPRAIRSLRLGLQLNYPWELFFVIGMINQAEYSIPNRGLRAEEGEGAKNGGGTTAWW